MSGVRVLYPRTNDGAAAIAHWIAGVNDDPYACAAVPCERCGGRHPDGYDLATTGECVNACCPDCGAVLVVIVMPAAVDEVAEACAALAWPPAYPGRPGLPDGVPQQGHDTDPDVSGVLAVPTRATWGHWQMVQTIARLAEDAGKDGNG